LDEAADARQLTMFCGSIASPQLASTIAAVIESCPQPAHNVDSAPS